MADNSAQNATDIIATDELVTLNGGASTGVKVQRVKPGFGVDGDFRDVSAAFPMPTMTPDVTATGALAALNATQALSLNGASGAAAQIGGTWVGTITFEGTLDGVSWFPVNAVSASTSSPQTTTTANGLYRLTPGGLSSIRANMTAFTSGSASVVLRASSGVGGTFANQILPVKQTDGTNTQAIKPASTAAVAGDSASVVALHPSSPLPTGANVIGGVNIAAAQTLAVVTTVSAVTAITNALPTGANVIGALTANQSINKALINGVAPLMGNGISGTGTQRVNIASDNTAFAVNSTLTAETTKVIGTVNVAAAQTIAVSQATAANLQATVTPAATTATAATLSSAATTNATSVKASAGSLYSVSASNVGAAAAFLKIFNLATAPTVGTSVPFLTIPIAASGLANINFGAQGMRMSTGIALSITNLVADADATAIAAAQVKVAIAYI